MRLTLPATLNLFALANIAALNFAYRWAPIDLPLIRGEEEDYFRQLQKITRKVSSHVKGPAVILRDDEDKVYVAIPADRQLENFKVKTRPRPVTLTIEPKIHQLSFDSCSDAGWELIRRFLEFEFQQQIERTGWVVKDAAGRFFFKEPMPSREDSEVDLLQGFWFRIVADGPGKAYICLDITHRYVDRKRLSQFVTSRNRDYMVKRLLGQGGNRKKGLRCLYEMGDRWFPIEVVDISDKPIGEETFSDLATGNEWTVYDYVVAKTRRDRHPASTMISPSDLTVYYRYPGRQMEVKSAPASLVRRMFKTGDRQVRGLHNRTILEPNDRFRNIEHKVRSILKNLTFNRVKVQISSVPLDEEVAAFALKSLKFNHGSVLTGVEHLPGGVLPAHDYPRRRRSLLEQKGILDQSAWSDPQYLIVPDEGTMPPSLRKLFQQKLEEQLKRLAPQFKGFKKVVVYPANVSSSATDLLKTLNESLEDQQIATGCALMVLPDWGDDARAERFHHLVKKKFYPDLKIQCAEYRMIESFYQHSVNEEGELVYSQAEYSKSRFLASYFFYLAQEYLILNRKFPFALKDSPNYDIYVGIDVHDRFVGFTFFYRTGERIVFDYLEIAKGPSQQRAEKLRADQIVGKLYNVLKRHLGNRICPNPNSIVLLRDGRSHGGEVAALKYVIQLLAKDGLLNSKDFSWAVVDLHKTSQIPFRIASRKNQQKKYDRAFAGTYRLLGRDHREAFLFPTGEPFNIKGSPKPLHLSLIDGENVNLEKIVEDVFGQCLLQFSASDRPSHVPVTIKLLDAFLEPLALPGSIVLEEGKVLDGDDDLDEDASLWEHESLDQIEEAP